MLDNLVLRRKEFVFCSNRLHYFYYINKKFNGNVINSSYIIVKVFGCSKKKSFGYSSLCPPFTFSVKFFFYKLRFQYIPIALTRK